MSPRRVQRRAPDEPSRPRRVQRRKPAEPAEGGSAGSPPRGDAVDDQTWARLGPPEVQEWPDGDWIVRRVPGAAATKLYRCPGCNQELRPGTAHVVVWPADAQGAAGRRHWHNACWQRRPRRPGPQARSK